MSLRSWWQNRSRSVTTRLPAPFWNTVRRVAAEHNMTVTELVASAVRLFIQQLQFGTVPGLPAALPEPQRVVGDHPCLHLSAETPSGAGAYGCSGTCWHPDQRGRPCHWVASSASSCPKFRLNRSHQRVGQS